MGSLTSLMDMAQQALIADQKALSVTANNVSNQNTTGYTREVVAWSATDAVTLSGITYNAGIRAAAVSQRDRILEQRVQQLTQGRGPERRTLKPPCSKSRTSSPQFDVHICKLDSPRHGDGLLLQFASPPSPRIHPTPPRGRVSSPPPPASPQPSTRPPTRWHRSPQALILRPAASSDR